MSDSGRAYVEGRMAGGDTKTEALRLSRRRLSDEVFRRLRVDEMAEHVVLDAPDSVAA